jgi:DNA-binding transcriptional MerR regulator
MFRISELARQFGLSRSTLLYYHRIGLLTPSGRSDAGYRLYSPSDRERLEAICSFRQAGLGIEDIRSILSAAGDDTTAIMQQRLRAVGKEIRSLQTGQRLLAGMLRLQGQGGPESAVDKEMFVGLLRTAGMDDRAMRRLHAEFERTAPEAHHNFLLMLGISENEIDQIRRLSAEAEEGTSGESSMPDLENEGEKPGIG